MADRPAKPDDRARRFLWSVDQQPTITTPQCLSCRHYHGIESNSCDAFAKIPIEVLTNKVDHRQPYPGDGGVRFSPADDR